MVCNFECARNIAVSSLVLHASIPQMLSLENFLKIYISSSIIKCYLYANKLSSSRALETTMCHDMQSSYKIKYLQICITKHTFPQSQKLFTARNWFLSTGHKIPPRFSLQKFKILPSKNEKILNSIHPCSQFISDKIYLEHFFVSFVISVE